MKKIIAKTTIPVLIGIFNVLFLLFVVDYAIYGNLDFLTKDMVLLKFFLPISIAGAVIVQYIIVLPVWKRFAENNKVIGLTIIPFTTLVCLLGGIVFTYLFWERDLGIGELLAVFLTGQIAFAIYWSSNLMLLKRLD
ncbi:MAG TPA: hypothetical protein PLH91_10120 [Tenuifilaceae bacterium]|nr:hypothetical protein [Tenuifilaceae bacterium]HPI45576.1 hypothetical protein [Tenuifilaceae bacterium]HPN22642.1 hypothetical protein [Tenuifilaceae bacterium]HPV57823.1 hypothetical protein [Tenuifilaceae bacterium]